MRRERKNQDPNAEQTVIETVETVEAEDTVPTDSASTCTSDVITIGDIPVDKCTLKNRGAKRAFFVAFFTTITVVGLIIGMLTVDIHGRRMSINDNTPVVQVSEYDDGSAIMKIHTFGYDQSLEVTTLMAFWHKFKEFFCIPD